MQPQCPPRGYGQPMMQNGPPSFQVPPSPGMPQAHPAGPYGDPSKTDALQHQGQWAAAIKHSDKAKEAMAKQQYDLGLHKRHQDARKTMPVPTRSGSNQGGLLGITGLPTISGPGVSGLSSKSTKAIEDTSPEGQGCKSGKKQPVADPSKSSSGSGDSNVPSTKYTDQYLLRLLRGPGPLPPSKSNSNGSSQRRTPAPNLSGGNSSSLHSSRSSQASFGRATMHYASVAKETSCQGSPKRLLSGMSSGGPLASRMARPLGPPVIREQKVAWRSPASPMCLFEMSPACRSHPSSRGPFHSCFSLFRKCRTR